MSDVSVVADRPAIGPSRRNGVGEDAGPANGRTIRRRSSLPGNRAVVGGFLIALSALGIFVAHSRATAGPSTSYVVARHDVPIGTRLTADDLTLLRMELAAPTATDAAFSSERLLIGATTVGPIRRGELVQAGDVVEKRSGAGELEVSFSLDAARALAGTLRPGERIDVLATFGAGGDIYTVTVVRQARVIETMRGTGPLAAGAESVLTVAVTSSDEALALTHAVNAGEVTLVRSTGTTVEGQVGQTYRAPSAQRGESADGQG